MGRSLIKPDSDVDFYVEWSTNVDNWTWCGTRAEAIADIGDTGGEPASARLQRADRAGSSALWGGRTGPAFGWQSEGLTVYNTVSVDAPRWLPRSNLAAYVKGCAAGDAAGAEHAYTEALED